MAAVRVSSNFTDMIMTLTANKKRWKQTPSASRSARREASLAVWLLAVLAESEVLIVLCPLCIKNRLFLSPHLRNTSVLVNK